MIAILDWNYSLKGRLTRSEGHISGFKWTPRISLNFKLVSVHHGEHKNGLFIIFFKTNSTVNLSQKGNDFAGDFWSSILRERNTFPYSVVL